MSRGADEFAGRLLLSLDDAFPVGMVASLRKALGEAVGSRASALLLVDYDQEGLRELVDESGPALPSVPEELVGRAFTGSDPVTGSLPDGGTAVAQPIGTHGERLGVLAVVLDTEPSADVLGRLAVAATVLGYVVPRASWYSDAIELTRRMLPLTLPAEIQWSSLPLRAYSCDRFDVAGQLCPAYEVGGDLFDYTLDADVLQVAALDAMGHGLGASLLGSLAVNALRNNRRAGLSLVDQVRGADRVLYGQHGGDKFVCGAFLRLDTATGALEAVNAGHPFGALVRGGRPAMIDVPAQLPMGLFERTDYEQHDLQLQRGDRLVLVSDGVLEAAPPGGEEYGEERLFLALERLEGVPAVETVRQMVRELRGYEGTDLRDDITVIVLDWRGPG